VWGELYMIKCFKIIFSAVLLGLVFGIPSGMTAKFDGLPWVNGLETITLSVVVPFLLALGWRFLLLRVSVLSLGVLLVLKILMFVGSPNSGWLVKLYPNLTPEQVSRQIFFKMSDSGSWVKTYGTSWNSEASGVLKKPWAEKLDFPLDWFLQGLSCRDTENKHVTMATEANPKNCFDNLNPILEVNGAVFIPKGNRFSIVAEGVQEGNLRAVNENNESFVLFPAKNIDEIGLQRYQLPKGGLWQISGKLSYKGVNWSLVPTLISSKGGTTSELGRDILWQNSPELIEKKNIIWFYKILSQLIDFGICFFLLVWASWAARGLVKQEILTLPLAFFSLLAVFITSLVGPVVKSILRNMSLSDPTNISHLGFSIIFVSVGLLCWIVWKQDFRNFQSERITTSIFLFYGITVFPFFSNLWRHTLGKWVLWSPGDDWLSYQGFARKIVVDGEWLNAGEGVFMMQPLYRYFVGIYHLLFGQSPFAQHIADVWCILGVATLIASLIIKFRLSAPIAFIASTIYLIINLIGAYRYHIGRGLVENHAMIFMMLAAWYIYRSREGEAYYKIILATLFGIFGYWTRQDHLGAIAGLAFLSLEPIAGFTGGWKKYWERFKLHWQPLVWYWIGGILSVFLLSYRNWYLGGDFFPADTNHPNFIGDYERGKFYLILTGNEWPTFPSISGILVSLGVFLALLALIWRPKPLENFPRSLGVIFIGLLFPYIFLWTGGYAPRFSIHILPLAVLSLAFLVNNIFNNNNLIQRLGWHGN